MIIAQQQQQSLHQQHHFLFGLLFDFPFAFTFPIDYDFSLSESPSGYGSSSTCSQGYSMRGSYLICFCCSLLPPLDLALALASLASSWRLLQSLVSFPFFAAETSASGFGERGVQHRARRCYPTIAGGMRYCPIMHAASSTQSFLRNSANSLAMSGAYKLLTVLLELVLVIGKMAFLNSLFSLRIFLSLENLPSHDGNCGNPRLSLIFYVGQTHVMKPKEGIRPHSCCFRMVRSKTSPKVIPRMPYTNLWKSWAFNGVFPADASRFQWTMMGTISLSVKKQSVRCCILIPENSARLSSFLAASKWLIITLLSFALRLRAERASTVILRETVRNMTWRQDRICRMSFWKVQTSCQRARSQPVPPSAMRISLSLRTSRPLLGLWNFTSRQWAARERIFQLLLSLQMQMTGILVCFSMLMMAATPPRSPELIPSTSSMIISGLVRLWKRSRLYEPLYSRDTPDLLRTSLALNSVTEQLYSMAIRRAEVVFPIPGSPLSSAPGEFILPPAFHPFDYLTSRLFPRMWMSYQLYSHSLRERI